MSSIAAPIIGAATSLLGGLFGSSAAKKASGVQAQNAYNAGQKILTTAVDANKGVSAAEGSADSLVLGASGQAKNAVTDATNAGVGRTLAAVDGANAFLNPYETTGGAASAQLLSMLANGQVGKPFTADMMEQYDPGYQFRIDQGSKALQRSAAAHGGALGGTAQTALTNYAQNAASSEYQNAFNRYQQSQAQQFNQLATLSGMGQSAANLESGNTMQGNEYASQLGLSGTTTAGNMATQGAEWAGGNQMQSNEYQAGNFMNAAQQWGNDVMGAGNALASGTMGAANAWSNALSGVGNAANQWNMLNMLAQPAAAPSLATVQSLPNTPGGSTNPFALNMLLTPGYNPSTGGF